MRSAALPLLLGLSLLTACGSEPAEYDPAVSEQDRQIGAEQHEALLAEFGGAYSGPQARYVADVGDKVAAAAELPGQCRFTLVNSDVVNAFAVPGCYIYITRGLLGLVNSEAELASVLAHEVGHIVANHSGRQQNRSLLRQLGVLAVGLITGSEALTRIAGQAAQFFTLRYSRTQEYEADDLGIRYLRAAGYDPYEAADMLGALSRNEQYLARTQDRDTARRMPEWTLTHPLTENRIERARAEAKATGLADNALPEDARAYFSAVDGLLYGDDPEQGFILGRRFLHPVMRIGFEAPAGYTLTNSPQAILLEGPDGARGEFSGGALPRGGLPAYVEALIAQLLGQTPAEIGQAQTGTANGVPLLTVPVRVQTDQGPATLSIAAYAGVGGQAYHFIIAAPGTPAGVDTLFRSFRLLSAQEAQSLRPRQIRVVAADSLQSVTGRMASDHPSELFLTLNDRTADQPLRRGEPVKIVTYAR